MKGYLHTDHLREEKVVLNQECLINLALIDIMWASSSIVSVPLHLYFFRAVSCVPFIEVNLVNMLDEMTGGRSLVSVFCRPMKMPKATTAGTNDATEMNRSHRAKAEQGAIACLKAHHEIAQPSHGGQPFYWCGQMAHVESGC
eukprot:scaffold47505_cov38-Prasinocladus_malaysianus.AAC.2